MRSVFWFVGLVLLLFAHSAWAGEYTIKSPADGAVVRPGKQFEVVIAGPPAKNVYVSAGAGWLSDSYLSVSPYRYIFDVPRDKRTGTYPVEVYIEKKDGTYEVFKTNVVVEPDVTGAKLVVDPDDVRFTFVGEARSMSVVVRSASSGSSVLASPDLTVQSSDPKVIVPIQGGREIVAAGPGSAVIKYGFHNLTAQVLVDVEPSSVPGDLNGDGRVDRHDIDLVQEMIDQPKAVPSDARDINGDGKIDALDVQALTALCTKPGCAPQ